MGPSAAPTGPRRAPSEGQSSPSLLAKLGLKDFPRLAAVITAGSLAVSTLLSCNEHPESGQENTIAAEKPPSSSNTPDKNDELSKRMIAPGYNNTTEGYVNYGISLNYPQPITVLIIPEGSQEAIVREFDPNTYEYQQINGHTITPQINGKFPQETLGYRVEVYNTQGEKLEIDVPPQTKTGLWGNDKVDARPFLR